MLRCDSSPLRQLLMRRRSRHVAVAARYRRWDKSITFVADMLRVARYAKMRHAREAPLSASLLGHARARYMPAAAKGACCHDCHYAAFSFLRYAAGRHDSHMPALLMLLALLPARTAR